MDRENEMLNNYRKRKIEEREEEIAKNATLIQNFVNFCDVRQIKLTKYNFDYIQTIGVVARFPNLINLLNNKIVADKKELVDVNCHII